MRQLKRVKNIQKNPKVAFLVDNYEEDWKRLWFVMIIGYGTLIEQGMKTEPKFARFMIFLSKNILSTPN